MAVIIILIIYLVTITSGCIFNGVDEEVDEDKVIVHFKIKNNSDNQTFSNISIFLDSKEVFNETLSFYEEGWREIDVYTKSGKHFVKAFENDTNTILTKEFNVKNEISIVITYVNGIYGDYPKFYFDQYDGDKLLY